ncbi:MAG: acetolactate synthase small subunit [Clostridiales bacterium]|nr:acetolactate synthase small subunit [Clostridiales bacterium]
MLVENQSGVLSRISGLFSRRGYNIDSLSVGVTENPAFSRVTIVTSGDEFVIAQIKNQVEKLVDVVRVVELATDSSVMRELALIKIKAAEQTRSAIVGIVDIFRAKIIDVSASSVTVEITGETSKIDAFLSLAETYGVEEIARTGLTGLQRGAAFIKEHEKFE